MLANDSDVDQDPLVVTGVTGGTGGTVALVSGSIVFTPTANFNGAGGFAYSVDDGSDTVPTSGNVAVTVVAVNDAPSLSLTPVVTSLKETADTSSARKVANISVSDIDSGTNGLSLTGDDAALFKIVGNDLFLLDVDATMLFGVSTIAPKGDDQGKTAKEVVTAGVEKK